MLLPEVISNRHRLKAGSENSNSTCYIYPVNPATEEELIRMLYEIRIFYKFDSSLSFDALKPEAENLIRDNGGQIPKNLISYEYNEFDDDGLEIQSIEQELRGLNEEKTTIENRIKEIQEYINKESKEKE